MSGVWQEPVVRIWGAEGGDPIGTGVLVQGFHSRVFLLTCAHVVNEALGGERTSTWQDRPADGEVICFDVPSHSGSKRHAARVVEWFPPFDKSKRVEHPVSDIALLEVLDGEAWTPAGFAPLSGSVRCVRPEDFDVVEDADIAGRREITGYGFARAPGAFAVGRITGIDGSGWLHLEGVGEKGDFIAPGFSGAPLFDVENNRNRILGIAVSVDGDKDKRLAFLQSTRNIWKACPQIARPYRGLRPFEEEDAPFFFGRDAFVAKMLEKTASFAILGVSAASGAGKSSALKAGLLPKLRAGVPPGKASASVEPAPLRSLVLVMRPENDPWKQLARAIVSSDTPGINPLDLDDMADERARLLRASPQKLVDYAKVLLKESNADRLVILVDQFEELFTLVGHGQPDDAGADRSSEMTVARTNEAAKAADVRLMAAKDGVPEADTAGSRQDFRDLMVATATLQGKPAIQWIYALRADFADRAFAHRSFADAVGDGNEFLAPMTDDELRAAIERPASELDVKFDEDTDKHPSLRERIVVETGTTSSALPLMQHVLEQLWKRLKGGRKLLHSDYDDLGRVSGALSQHAQGVFDALTPAEKELAPRLFSRLVNVKDDGEATRRIATRSELGEDGWALAMKLASEDSRLLTIADNAGSKLPTPDDRDRHVRDGRERAEATGTASRSRNGKTRQSGQSVEVAHEALLRSWPLLGRWVREDQRFLLWRQGLERKLRDHNSVPNKDGTWLTGGPLLEAVGRAATRPEDLTEAELDFIAQSNKIARDNIEKERRQAEELRKALDEAKTQAANANNQAMRATRWTRWAIGAAVLMLAAALVAGWQWETARNTLRDANEQRAKALRQAEIAEAEERRAQINESRYFAGVARRRSGAGEHAIAQSILSSVLPQRPGDAGDRPMEPLSLAAARDLAERDGVRLILGDYSQMVNLTVSEDGRLIVAYSGDVAEVWDAASGSRIADGLDHGDTITSAEFVLGDRYIATASHDGNISIWDAGSGHQVGQSLSHGEKVSDIITSEDGRFLASVGTEFIKFWNIDSRTQSAPPLPLPELISANQKARRIAVWSNDAIGLLDIAEGKIESIPGKWPSPLDIALTPDARLVALSTEDEVALVDIRSGRKVSSKKLELEEGPEAAGNLFFSADGRQLIIERVYSCSMIWLTADGHKFEDKNPEIFWSEEIDSPISGASLSRSGKILTVTYDSGEVVAWNAVSAEIIDYIASRWGAASRPVVMPNGQHAAVGFENGKAIVWGWRQSVESLTDDSAGYWITDESGRFALVQDSDSARLYDAWNRKWIGAPVASIGAEPSFSADGAAFSASASNIISLYDTVQGRLIGEITTNTGGISEAKISPDGRWIAVVGDDLDLGLYHLDAQRPTLQAKVESTQIKFSADGRHLLADSPEQGTFLAWTIPSSSDQAVGPPLRLVHSDGDRSAPADDCNPEEQECPYIISPELRIGSKLWVTGGRTLNYWSIDGSKIAGPVTAWRVDEEGSENEIVSGFHISANSDYVAMVSNSGKAGITDATGKILSQFNVSFSNPENYANVEIRFSADSNRLFVHDLANFSLHLYDWRTGTNVGDAIRDAVHWAISADGSLIATASDGAGSLRFWETVSFTQIGQSVPIWPLRDLVGTRDQLFLISNDEERPNSALTWPVHNRDDIQASYLQASTYYRMTRAESDALGTPASGPMVAQALATDCDKLASDFYDPEATAPGISLDDIDSPTAISVCQRALSDDSDNPRLTFLLGRAFWSDENDRFDKEAVAAFGKAADVGYTRAFGYLAAAHRHGNGVAVDAQRALQLYQESFDAGDRTSGEPLGDLYWRGEGTDADREKAIEIWTSAAMSGDAKSHERLGWIAEFGRDGKARDLAKALYHYAVAVRLMEYAGDEGGAVVPRFRRASLARIQEPVLVARKWREAMQFEPVVAK